MSQACHKMPYFVCYFSISGYFFYMLIEPAVSSFAHFLPCFYRYHAVFKRFPVGYPVIFQFHPPCIDLSTGRDGRCGQSLYPVWLVFHLAAKPAQDTAGPFLCCGSQPPAFFPNHVPVYAADRDPVFLFETQHILTDPERNGLAFYCCAFIHITSGMPVLVFSPEAFVLRNPNYGIAAHPSAISLKWFCLQYLTAGRRDIERGSLSVRKILPSGRKHSELSSFVAMKQIIPVSFSQFSVPELMDFIRRILTEDREALFFTYALKIPPFLRADDLKRNIPFRESLFQPLRISPDKLPYFRNSVPVSEKTRRTGPSREYSR